MSTRDSNNQSLPPPNSRSSREALRQNTPPPRRPGNNEPPKENDIVIAIVGQTGAGKSSFIQIATGHTKIAGHGLQPHTKHINPIRAPFANHIVLVDTPGVDGVSISDLDSLKLVHDWLQRTYGKGFYLSGIIYLYPISINRLSPPSLLKYLDTFQKLCGEDCFRKVILGTTMWQDVDLSTGLEREAEMVKDHWTEMLKRGSQKVRFENTAQSAWRILNRVIAPEKRLALGKIPPNMAPPTTSSPTEDHCRSLIAQILGDKYRVRLIKKLAGDDAQHVVDFLNINLLQGGFSSTLFEHALSVLRSIIKSAQISPRCYELKGVAYDPTQPVVRATSADVYKAKHGDKFLCLKMVRLVDNEILWMQGVEPIQHARVSHENLVPFYGIYYIGQTSRICLVSPWVKNGNLRDYLKNQPQLPRLPFVFDVVDGLSYLHRLDIVHGGLKPQNVLISDEGRALITDFGTSYRSMVAASTSLVTSMIGGTLYWTAPELLSGDLEEPIKPCDVWSFGCLCYEIFSDKVPFYQYPNDPQVISALSRKELPLRLKFRCAGADVRVEGELWDLMLKCWNYAPEGRPTCEGLRELIVKFGYKKRQPSAMTEDKSGLEFWEAMRDESTVDIDYDRVENVLLRTKAQANSGGERV